MSNEIQTHGSTLLQNGYQIVPIRNGLKHPCTEGWQNMRLGADDLAKYAGNGVGVLCGIGPNPIVAIDVDVYDEALAARFSTWCQDTFGMTCERVGQAPKVLLAYRITSENLGKSSSAKFEYKDNQFHRVEVLCRGQQFVAYHTHPTTG